MYEATLNLALAHPDKINPKSKAARWYTDTRDLARRLKITPEQAAAILAANDAVRQTQYQYGREARQPIMWGKQSSLLVFYMFIFNTLWFIRYAPGGRQALLIMLAFAGLSGFPFAEDANDLVRYLARKAGYDFDPLLEARRLLVELDANPDLFLEGVAHDGFGLPALAQSVGIPLPEIDWSGSVGMGNILPGLPLPTGSNFETNVGKSAIDIAGAGYQAPFEIAKAIFSDEPDKYRRFVNALPRTLKNSWTAFKILDDQKLSTLNDGTLLPVDPSNPLHLVEVIMVALGLRPTRFSDAQTEARVKYKKSQYWSNQRQKLIRNFVVTEPHTEARRAATADIIRFNQTLLDKNFNSMAINSEALEAAVMAWKQRQALETMGLGSDRRGISIYRDLDPLF